MEEYSGEVSADWCEGEAVRLDGGYDGQDTWCVGIYNKLRKREINGMKAEAP